MSDTKKSAALASDAGRTSEKNPLHKDTIKDAVLQALMTAALDHRFYGKERRITRAALARMAHTDDRTARAAVEELREQGEYICITRDGKGYWYGTRAEYEATVIRSYRRLIAADQKKVTAFERRGLEGQVTFDEMVL